MKRSPSALLGPLAFAVLAAASFALFWQLRLAVRFIDETDVPVFGRLLAQGRILHGDLFSHHTHLEPLAAWVVARLFPAAGLEGFRALVWALQLLAALTLARSAVFTRPAAGWLAGGLYLLLVTLVGPLWFGHLIVAYNLWGALCAVSLAAFFLPWLAGRGPGRGAAGLGGVAASLWVMGTPFTVYPAAALLALAWAAGPWVQKRPLLYFAAGIGLGLGLQLLWLLGHADLGRLWQQSIVFNAKVFAPFTSEPLGQAARFAAVAQDLKAVFLQGRLLEKLFPLGALLAAGLAFSVGASRVGNARAALAALFVLLFFVGLRMRGGHWRSTPQVFASLLVACAFLGLLMERGRLKLALALYLLLAATGVQAYRAGRSLYGQDSFQQDPVLDLARDWERTLPLQETVLVVPANSAVYLFARRAPGMDAVYGYPWIMAWERQGGRGPHGGFCEQVLHYRPSRILLDRHAMIWTYPWSEHQPACLDGLLKQHYRRSPFAGREELWERRMERP